MSTNSTSKNHLSVRSGLDFRGVQGQFLCQGGLHLGTTPREEVRFGAHGPRRGLVAVANGKWPTSQDGRVRRRSGAIGVPSALKGPSKSPPNLSPDKPLTPGTLRANICLKAVLLPCRTAYNGWESPLSTAFGLVTLRKRPCTLQSGACFTA